MKEIKSLQLHGSSSQDFVIDKIKDIGNIIKEYGLQEGILTDTIKEIYDMLMKNKWHGIAATLAKKYGL